MAGRSWGGASRCSRSLRWRASDASCRRGWGSCVGGLRGEADELSPAGCRCCGSIILTIDYCIAGRWFCKNDPSAFLGCYLYDDGAFSFSQSSFSFTTTTLVLRTLLPRTHSHLVNEEASTMKHGHMERVEPDLTSAGATHNGRYKYSKELNRKSRHVVHQGHAALRAACG